MVRRWSGLVSIVAVALMLGGCGTNLPPIASNRREVQQLDASTAALRIRFLPNGDLPALERLRELDHLDFFGGCAVGPALLNDAGLATLAKLDLPKLNSLSLGYCENITDAGLAHVGQMHTVGWLGLLGSPKVTDEGLPSLLGMKGLRSLDLRGCPGITDKGLEILATKTDWVNVWLDGCPNVTAAGVARLQAALPQAKVTKDDASWEMNKCR